MNLMSEKLEGIKNQLNFNMDTKNKTNAKPVRNIQSDINCARGEIWKVDLGNDKVGSVQSGYRPILIVSNNAEIKYSKILKAIPITSQFKRILPIHVFLEKSACGLEEDSLALAEQTTTIAKEQLKSYVGKIDLATMQSIEKALVIEFGIDINNHMDDKLHMLYNKSNVIDMERIKSIQQDIREMDEILLQTDDLTKSENKSIFFIRARKIKELQTYCKEKDINVLKFYNEDHMNDKISNNNKKLKNLAFN